MDSETEELISYNDARILWAHVMHKAIEDFKFGKRAKGAESLGAYRDARGWIWSDDEEFPSFLFLCEVLELDAGRIRRKLSEHELSQQCEESSVLKDVVEPGLREPGHEGPG